MFRCLPCLCLFIFGVSLFAGCDDSAPSGDNMDTPDVQRRVVRLDMTVADATPPAADSRIIADTAAIVVDMAPVDPDAAVVTQDMAPPPPLECDENIAALPATAIGEYGPVTRIDQMQIPGNVQAA